MATDRPLYVFNFPDVSQVEVAAWLQVIGSMAALFFAFYVPIRMRKIDALERLDSVTSCVGQVDTICQYYEGVVGDLDTCLGTVPVELTAAIDACKSHMANPSTPAILLPSLSHAVNAYKTIEGHWKATASHPERRQDAFFVGQVAPKTANITQHHQALKGIVKHWRKKHWFVLLFA